ncbi:MAG: ECF transporter S component [Eubacterium sp.]|nr:ECF transporter S component [Eubacterium sp.]
MSKQTMRTAQFTQITLLIALLAVLAFTPLGFIQIPPVSITILHIPVIIGAIVMGPKNGGILGLAFGFFSMLSAIFQGGTPIDLLFSPFASGAPLQSLIMCYLPRILLGVIAGGLYQLLSEKLPQRVAIGLSAGIAALCHTILVLGLMWFLFDAIPLKEIFVTIAGINGILELAAGIVVSVCVCVPLLKYNKTHGYQSRIRA